MGIQPYRKEKLQVQVATLYQQGLSLREVGAELKMSHENVRQIWKSIPVDSPLLTRIAIGNKIEDRKE